jgi:hypothetical protein
MLRWMLFDPGWGLAALGRRHGPDAVFGEVEAYFDWKTEGLAVPRDLELGLARSIDQMVQALSGWRPWDDFARADVRAHQALTAVWQARANQPRSLDQAAWACRAAWAASEPYSLAQSEALLEALMEAPLLIEH